MSRAITDGRSTVRVRIAVAVGINGKYAAYGDNEYNDNEMRYSAVYCLTDEYKPNEVAIRWVEATIPLPESVTVEGEVTE